MPQNKETKPNKLLPEKIIQYLVWIFVYRFTDRTKQSESNHRGAFRGESLWRIESSPRGVLEGSLFGVVRGVPV